MSNIDPTEVLPSDYWFTNVGNPAGDIALCDPFSGLPIAGPTFNESPDNPPELFACHRDLKDGYELVREMGSRLQVGILLTEVKTAGDLPADYEEIVSEVDFAAYALKGAVCYGHNQPRGIKPGGISIGGEVVPSDPYWDRILNAGIAASKFPYCLDPPNRDEPTLTGSLVHKLEDVVTLQRQQDPEGHGQLTALDMVYTNTLQWYQVGRLGMQLGMYLTENYGTLPERICMTAPYESVDIGRKLVASGVPMDQVGLSFGEDSLAWRAASYASVMDSGIIPGYEV